MSSSNLLTPLLSIGSMDVHFKGAYTTLAALQAAHPTGDDGDYAFIDGGAGQYAVVHIWDKTDNQWSPADGGAITPEQIEQFYESRPNTNKFTDAEKTKLAGVASGAEVNVQSDWDQTNSDSDDFIKNKPTLGTSASKNVGTYAELEAGDSTKLSDNSSVKKLVNRKWSDVTGSLDAGETVNHLNETYQVVNPIESVIANPVDSGRTYTNFNGTSQYITIPTINLVAGDVVKFKFLAPAGVLSSDQVLFDYSGAPSSDLRFTVTLVNTGNVFDTRAGILKVDGVSVPANSPYPVDSLVHTYEYTLTQSRGVNRIATNYNATSPYKGRIYDLEVIRGGERIHYYPLRTDVVDYLAGNLVKDEEFTNPDIWTKGTGWSVGNNKTTAIAGTQSILSIPLTESILIGESVRVRYDATISTGSLTVLNSGLSANTTSGTYDAIAVYTGGDTLLQLQKSSDFVGSVSNVRVIKLNELSPSASFDSATGFILSGGVTVSGGQAVFGSGGGVKSIRFVQAIKTGEVYRFDYKFSGRTKGSVRVQSNTGTYMAPQSYVSTDGTYTFIGTALQDQPSASFWLLTESGFDGNVEYWSVTEVTDGTEVGSPVHEFEKDFTRLITDKHIGTKADIDAGVSVTTVPSVKAVRETLDSLKATDGEFIAGTSDKIPDSKQVIDYLKSFGFGTSWEQLTGSVGYQFETYYRNGKYLVRNPMDDVTIAPPTTAGRTFTNFNGSTQYITVPTINLVAGDVVKFKFLAPTEKVSGYLFDSDLANDTNRAYCILGSDGRYIVTYSPFYVDGIEVYNGTLYPTDGLIHSVEIPVTLNRALGTVGNRFSFDAPYKGRIYDLEVIRGGERIHYYPLRVDAVDYLAGNLVVDEEFTNAGNLNLTSSSVTVANNAVNFNASPTDAGFQITPTTGLQVGGTYRAIYDYNVTSGSVGFEFIANGVADGATRTGQAVSDEILVLDNIGTGRVGCVARSASTTATIKNLRVIKLNELSPSASFSSAAGFTLSGVTIAGGQAVFDGVTAGLSFKFDIPIELRGKKLRVTFKCSGATKGTYRILSNTDIFKNYTLSDTYDDFTFVYTNLQENANAIFFQTTNGWDGSVEYFSVTEVTDGEEVGSPVHEFEPYWSALHDFNV